VKVDGETPVKIHCHDVGALEERSVYCTVVPIHTVSTEAEKLGTGTWAKEKTIQKKKPQIILILDSLLHFILSILKKVRIKTAKKQIFLHCGGLLPY
jgi:6-phosphogluconate dehydrogenase